MTAFCPGCGEVTAHLEEDSDGDDFYTRTLSAAICPECGGDVFHDEKYTDRVTASELREAQGSERLEHMIDSLYDHVVFGEPLK